MSYTPDATVIDAEADRLLKLAGEAPSGVAIATEVLSLGNMLLQKNINYGNSALSPVRVFSKASIEEQILVRLDDKLSRLQRGNSGGVAVILDLIGYLVLLRVQRNKDTL